MKRIFTLLAISIITLRCLANNLNFMMEEIPDSISSKELDEVVVEASNQRINGEVSTYIPLARQKNAAQNAISLLSQMSIPQIDVDPISQAVKTAHGQNVSIFIDYIPATAEDLQASAYNFFHTSWEENKETLSSEYYNFDRTTFGTQLHARYSVSVTYTVGYGKKVQRNSEISGAGTAGSAILK